MSQRKDPSGRAQAKAATDRQYLLERLEHRRMLSAALPKIGQVLGYLATDFATRPVAARSRAVIRHQPYAFAVAQPNADLVRTDGDTVLIKAVANRKGGKNLAAQLTALGATVTGRYGVMVTAAVPVSALAKVNALSTLKYADASYAPVTSAGRTDSYGAAAMNADKGQKQYAVDGTGVTVGVLSDSYNDQGGAAAGVASGDLPAAGVNVLQEYTSGTGADEGRAMAEIVHDVAPGSPIAFHTAFEGEPNFAQGIIDLAKPVALGGAGAKVIVDDVFYYDEPFFQDGIVAQAVNTAAGTYGASYFSAAGNFARKAYESTFRPVSTTVPGVGVGVFQDFDPGAGVSALQQITIPGSGKISLTMQWDAPYASASAAAGGSAGPTNSVGAYLIDSSQSGLLTSETTSRVNGDAYQILSFSNANASPLTAYLAFRVTAGAAPGYIKYVNFGNATINTFATNSGASFGHSSANGGLGVAAAAYLNTPAFNVSPPQKESFTSAGGTPFFFNPNGTPTGAVYRQQPAITAPDGAATTFFSGLYTSDAQYHFYGTSAAAPHAAGVAALLLQAKPSLSNTQVYSTMKSNTVDMLSAGYDYDTGFGLVQADAALAAVAGSSLGGTVFRDLNNNGVNDGGDTAVAGQTVFLDSNNNGVADTGSGTVSAAPALAVPDALATYASPSRVSTSLGTSFGGRVTGLTVSLNATSPRASDFGFTLITPSGVRIPLSTVIGGYTGGGSGYDLTYSDAAATYIQAVSSAGVLSGTYKPQTPLAAAVGENATGTWTLEARDYVGDNTGTLNSWSLNISYADPTVTTDGSGNYAFNALTPSAFYGTYRVRTATLSGYTMTVPASAYDLTLGRASTTTANFAFAAAALPATFASSIVDDGAAQRSRVRTVTVTFNGTIAAAGIAAGAFSLVQTSGSSFGSPVSSWAVNVAAVTTPAAGQTAVALSFAGPALTAGSLADGRYRLTVNGNLITDTSGLKVDAANTGVAGSGRAINFFRLAADADGSAVVDFNDFLVLQTAFGSSAGSPAFVAGLDLDGSDTIDFNDFLILQSNFNATV